MTQRSSGRDWLVEDEIEITPEMISAGIRDFALWNASEDDCALIVESVYRAMYEAKRTLDPARSLRVP